MFLDDELLKMCEIAEAGKPEGVQKLNVDICRKCEDYYKTGLNELSTGKEIKIRLDKAFNLFDSFVRMALKSEDFQTRILGELFKKHTFKKQFLANKKMNEIYNTL